MNRINCNVSFTGYIKASEIKGRIPTRYDDILKEIALAREEEYMKANEVLHSDPNKTYNLGDKFKNTFQKLKKSLNNSQQTSSKKAIIEI